jgi:hypothetical protein
MKMHLKSYGLLSALLLGMTGTSPAQLTNIYCGAVSTNVGAKLSFVNGTNFSVSSGFVQPLTYQRVANRYGTNVCYTGTNLLFTALSAMTNVGSAAIGSYIVCEVVSVSGPAGGVLYFWEQGNGRPTYAFPVNGIYPAGQNRFVLSNCENGAGRPDGDPYGGIRGRRIVVDKAGEYRVTFKLRDASANHPTLTYAPIHLPSDPLTIKFSTGVDVGITGFGVTNGVSTIVYKHGFLTNMVVETSTNLANWTTVFGPSPNPTPTGVTTNFFTNAPGLASLFYRLHGVTPP